MSNYKEQQASGVSWQRGYSVSISNKLGEIPKITFYEEEAINFGGKILTNHIGQLEESMMDVNKTFDIYDPTTETKVGVTSSYLQLYILIYSLYNTLARERDDSLVVGATGILPTEPIPQDPQPEGNP
jgi:hypothetical protein